MPEDLPPEYDENEFPGHALDDEDEINIILDDIEVTDYIIVDKILNQPEMTPQKTRSYLSKVMSNANFRRNHLKGYKARVTHAYKQGEIAEAERTRENKRIDNASVVLNQYIKHYAKRREGIKGWAPGKAGNRNPESERE